MVRNVWLLPLACVGFAVGARAALGRARHTDLAGKVVLITGGSRGLGLALAREFAAVDADIVIAARDASELERARQQIERSGATVMAEVCDVSQRDQVRTLVQHATERFGRIDVLVN